MMMRRFLNKTAVALMILPFLFTFGGPSFANSAEVPDATRTIPDALAQAMGLQVFDDRILAPDLAAPNTSGVMHHLSDYKGDLVVLNFWATWCVPCRKEIPSLDAFSRKWSGSGVRVVSVAMDRRIGHVTEFMKKVPVSYPVLLGRKGRIDSRYFGLGIPQTYLIDSRGYLIGRLTGPRDWLSPDAEKLVGAILSSGKGSAGKKLP
ncbi:MAG: TlpA family protein disulfide reductase [Leptospirillum sp.]